MANGVIIPNNPQDKIQLTTASMLYRDGNTIVLTLNGQYIDSNAYEMLSIPSNLLPTASIINALLVARSVTPTHTMGYASLGPDGRLTPYEPYNGTYRVPTDVYLYGEIVWKI